MICIQNADRQMDKLMRSETVVGRFDFYDYVISYCNNSFLIRKVLIKCHSEKRAKQILWGTSRERATNSQNFHSLSANE